MPPWLQLALTAAIAILGSSGFWAFMQHRGDKNNATTGLMMGLAYSHITTLGIKYIDRGYITTDELEELQKYFFKPYKTLGGNGVAERIMGQVLTLPLGSHGAYPEIFRNSDERIIRNVPVVSQQHG